MLYDTVMLLYILQNLQDVHRVNPNVNNRFQLITYSYWLILLEQMHHANTKCSQQRKLVGWGEEIRGYMGIICILCSFFFKPKTAFKNRVNQLKRTTTIKLEDSHYLISKYVIKPRNQNAVILSQRQTYRPMDQNRELRNKPSQKCSN